MRSTDDGTKQNALRLVGLQKRLGGLVVLRRITADIEPATITAFIGPNGAGKTTLFHTIAGNLAPDSGKVFLGDRDITAREPWWIARLGIGRLFQDAHVFAQLSSLENVQVGLSSPLQATRSRGGQDRVNHGRGALELLAEWGLESHARILAGQLSFGQQRRLALARLFAMEPDVFLLDEPSTGLGPDALENLEAQLRRLVREERRTVLLIEHDLNVVARLADHLHFLHEGTIVYSGTVEEVLADQRVRRLYLGL